MFAVLQSRFGEFVMGPDRSHHSNDVNIWRLQNFIGVRCESDRGMRLMQAFLTLPALIADENHFRVFMRVEIAHDIRSPIAVANYTDANHRAPWNLLARSRS